MSSGSLRFAGVTALAAAALWVSRCGGQAPSFASAAEIAAVIDDNQRVIGPVKVHKYVQNLRRKLSESRPVQQAVFETFVVLGNASSTTRGPP